MRDYSKLKQHFYTAASPECDPYQKGFLSKAFKPAASLEIHNGLTGIATYYDFPDDMDPTAYERMIREKYHDHLFYIRRELVVPEEIEEGIRNEWDKLKKLNPTLRELEHLDEGDLGSVWDCLHGVTSLFNEQDIDFFLSFGDKPAARTAHEDPVYKNKRDECSALLKAPIQWVPSPETLLHMHRQLVDKRGKDFDNIPL